MITGYQNKIATMNTGNPLLITKAEALRVWSDPKTKVLFAATGFETFEKYWEECEKINALTFGEQQNMIERAKTKLEEIHKEIEGGK